MAPHVDVDTELNPPRPPARVSPGRTPARRRQALRWAVLLITVAALLSIVPLWAPLVLAAWGAIVVWPLYQWFVARIHRRKGAAALATVLLVLVFLAPLLIVTLSLSAAAVDLIQRVQHSKTGEDALRALTAGNTDLNLSQFNPRQMLDLARRHGASALGFAQTFFGAATAAVIGIVVFIAGFHSSLVNGPRGYAWLLERSPLTRANTQRFANVFVECGRGLVVGVGGTALLQGVVATIGFVATGVPQPFVLGLLTVFASLIPSVGSALVCAPVTLGLALSGRPGAAVVMGIVSLVVSIVDNLMRPVLSRYAKLRLPSFVLFVSMLGGIAAFGGWGLLIGPLFVRLASEGLTMLKESNALEAP